MGLKVSRSETSVLAAVLAYNPQLVYSTGFQLSVAAVFGILLLRKPLKSLVEHTLFAPFRSVPESVSNLFAVSLSAQIATAPIIAAAFGEVSVIGALINLLAVPLSGPILTLGLLSSLAGNVAPIRVYPLNAANGFLVTLLVWVSQVASAMPFAVVPTPAITPALIAPLYAGCLPAAFSGSMGREERWPLWGGLLLLWVALWLVLVGLGSG